MLISKVQVTGDNLTVVQIHIKRLKQSFPETCIAQDAMPVPYSICGRGHRSDNGSNYSVEQVWVI